MCAFLGPKMGIFKKCLELSEMARNAIKFEKKLFLGGIVFWYWIVLFLVLNILGIVNKKNPIMLRSLSLMNKKSSSTIFSHSITYNWEFEQNLTEAGLYDFWASMSHQFRPLKFRDSKLQ